MSKKTDRHEVEDVNIAGRWWLPDLPNDVVYGDLKGSNGKGFHLDLFGGWGTDDEPLEGDIIQGANESGQPITLLNCFCTRMSGGFYGPLRRTQHYAHFAIVGVHIKSADELVLRRVTLGLHFLDLWDTIVFQQVEWSEGHRRVSIAYEMPEPRTICTTEHAKVKLCLAGPNIHWSAPGRIESIGYSHRMVIEASNPMLFFDKSRPGKGEENSFIEVIVRLVSFLSVAGLAASFPYEVEAFLPIEDGASQPYRALKIMGTFRLPDKVIQRGWHDLLFHWGHLAGNTETHLNAWMDFQRKCPRPVHLYMDVLEKGAGYGHLRFQQLVQALEGIHRHLFPCQENDGPELKVRIQKLYTNMPKELQDHVAERTVRNRACDEISSIRHDLAHSLGHMAPSGNRFYTLCLFMEFVLITHFLKAMGFDEAFISTRMRECKEYGHLPGLLMGKKNRLSSLFAPKGTRKAVEDTALSASESQENGAEQKSPSETSENQERGHSSGTTQ